MALFVHRECQRNPVEPPGSYRPTMHLIRHRTLVPSFVALLLLLLPAFGGAQQLDSARAGAARPAAPRAQGETSRSTRSMDDSLRPPISPRRAFLYSFLVPGAGQARLDRGYAGAMFFLIEVSAITLARRSAEDLRIARRFSGDSIPLRYTVDPVTGAPALDGEGNPQVAAWRLPRYDAAYVRTRKLHYEDWLAVVAFNHLFAGADAFVAAQLWDLPGKVGLRQSPFGPLIQASFSFR
jgi:hypothetical protein